MQTFRSMDEYVEYVTAGRLRRGEVFCLGFIPSAFFPREVVQYFFERKDVTASYRRLATLLSDFGRKVIDGLKRGEIRIAIEYSAVKKFIETGVVHKARPNFQATVATRLHVIKHILECVENVYMLVEPAPFAFRLTPPDRVVIDVDYNVVPQTIQGLAFHELTAFRAFSEEFERLVASSRNAYPVSAISSALDGARIALERGGYATL